MKSKLSITFYFHCCLSFSEVERFKAKKNACNKDKSPIKNKGNERSLFNIVEDPLCDELNKDVDMLIDSKLNML